MEISKRIIINVLTKHQMGRIVDLRSVNKYKKKEVKQMMNSALHFNFTFTTENSLSCKFTSAIYVSCCI